MNGFRHMEINNSTALKIYLSNFLPYLKVWVWPSESRRRHKFLIKSLAMLTPVLLLFPGCAKLTVNMVGAPMLDTMVSEMNDSKSYRLALEGLPANILTASAAAEISGENLSLLTNCAYMHFAYGLFIEDEKPEYATEIFGLGKSYGMRALMTNRRFRKGVEAGIPIRQLVRHLDENYAAALFWTAFNGGFSVIHQLDDPMAMMEMGDITAMVKRVLTLDPDYFYGAGKIFMGCYYAMIPLAMDPEAGPANAAQAFRQAAETTGGKLLLGDLFQARFLAVNTGDEARFKALLKRVLSSDSQALPGGTLMNELAKAKARYYLANRNALW